MDKLPNIHLLNYDGTALNLVDAFLGKETFFVFASLYSKRCIELLPDLADLLRHGLELAVVTNGEVEENDEIARHFGWTFPVFTMTNSEMAEQFKVYETPSIRIYGDQGLLLNKGIINAASDVLFYIQNMHARSLLSEVSE
jgi:hypothetical protein